MSGLMNVKDQLKKHAQDTGSSQMQICFLTEDIIRLTAHVNANKKDSSSRRGLLKKVAARKKFLKYLKRTDAQEHKKVLTVLGLKK